MKFRAVLIVIVCAVLLSCSDSSKAPAPKQAEGRAGILDEGNSSAKKIKTTKQKRTTKFPDLSLDFLFNKKAGGGANEVQRNMVAMEEDPVVVAERKKREEEARKLSEEAAKKAEEERRKMKEELAKNPPPPEPPPIPFEFIGYMGRMDDHIGIFRLGGRDDDLVLCKKGDTINKDFKIIEIGYESAEIGFEGFSQTKAIPLVAGGK